MQTCLAKMGNVTVNFLSDWEIFQIVFKIIPIVITAFSTENGKKPLQLDDLDSQTANYPIAMLEIIHNYENKWIMKQVGSN